MSQPSSFEAPTRHEKYYLQEDLITFLVENTLFRVHRFPFRRESDFFEGLFSLDPPAGQEGQGSSDEHPLALPGVTVNEFEALVEYFYHGERGIRSPEEQWVLLLSIATRYDFDNLRERAIQGISSLVPPVDPVRKIELAVRYDVVQWLESAYVSLCTRPHPLTPSEAARVGPNVSRKVGRCRAEWVTANRDTGTCQTPKKSGELAKEIVRQVFWPYGPAP